MLGCTLEEAQARIDSRQYAEWRAYYSLEPFGGERLDIVIGQLCAMVANAMRSKGKRASRIEDFMLFTGTSSRDRGKVTDPEQMAAMLRGRFGDGGEV